MSAPNPIEFAKLSEASRLSVYVGPMRWWEYPLGWLLMLGMRVLLLGCQCVEWLGDTYTRMRTPRSAS